MFKQAEYKKHIFIFVTKLYQVFVWKIAADAHNNRWGFWFTFAI